MDGVLFTEDHVAFRTQRLMPVAELEARLCTLGWKRSRCFNGPMDDLRANRRRKGPQLAYQRPSGTL